MQLAFTNSTVKISFFDKFVYYEVTHFNSSEEEFMKLHLNGMESMKWNFMKIPLKTDKETKGTKNKMLNKQYCKKKIKRKKIN